MYNDNGKTHTTHTNRAHRHTMTAALFSFDDMKEYAESFYKSKAWQNCRAEYVKTKQGLCERCLKAGVVTPGEIVHHKIFMTPENIHRPEIVLSFENLELLCRAHHAQMHGQAKRFTVDAAGHVAPRVGF